ncbi:60s ribosomal l20 [Pyrrhoderma noxium]|uniref:60s ribosomal l20 n=1 Tax=Pyrrhoderma noxium TaxID=2282107 RepID=A0A286UD24_9AGAM|nr:60s ribosomal l20 [Pyrrhoderma noxium]
MSSAVRIFARTYATRRPVRPPLKVIDPLLSSPNATAVKLEDGMTLIHRPPPSAPSVFSTTALPASPLLLSKRSDSETVPPRLRKERIYGNHVLTEDDFAKMQKLRDENPSYYTRSRLAKLYKCPPFLVAQKRTMGRTQEYSKRNKEKAKGVLVNGCIVLYIYSSDLYYL